MAGFDLAKARADGRTDDEIYDYLTQSRPKFNAQQALTEGKTKQEIIDYLANSSSAPVVPPRPTISIPMKSRQGWMAGPGETIGAPGLNEEMGWGAKAMTLPLDYFKHSMEQTGEGLTHMATPQSGGDFAGGLSDATMGTLQTALPFFAPGMIAHPLPTLFGMATGGVADLTTQGLLGLLQADEGYRKLAGTGVGLAAGMLSGKVLGGLAERLAPYFNAARNNPELQKLLTRVVIGKERGEDFNKAKEIFEQVRSKAQATASPAPPKPPPGFDVTKGSVTAPGRPAMGPPRAPMGPPPAPSGALPNTTFPAPPEPVYPPGFEVSGAATTEPMVPATPRPPVGPPPAPGGVLPGTTFPTVETPAPVFPPGFQVGEGATTGPIPPGAPGASGMVPPPGGLLPGTNLPNSITPPPPGFAMGEGATTDPIPVSAAGPAGPVPAPGGLLPGTNLPATMSPIPGFDVGTGTTSGPIPQGQSAPGVIPPVGGALPGQKFPEPPAAETPKPAEETKPVPPKPKAEEKPAEPAKTEVEVHSRPRPADLPDRYWQMMKDTNENMARAALLKDTNIARHALNQNITPEQWDKLPFEGKGGKQELALQGHPASKSGLNKRGSSSRDVETSIADIRQRMVDLLNEKKK